MKKYELIIYKQHVETKFITLNELGRLVGKHPAILKRYIAYGLIDPKVESPEPLFDDSIVVKVQKIERLKNDLGLNLMGCGVVMDLLEQISDLEKKIQHIRRKKIA